MIKLLDAGIIYPISDSKWVSPIHVVPKWAGLTVVENKDGELVPTRVQSGWRVCIDYRKLNAATRKDHFPLPFIDQMVERLAGHAYYCFLDGYSGCNQVPVDPEDQEKMTFTCPFGNCTRSYKEWMKRAHDQNILRRSFEPGQKVLLYNSRLHLFPGKLRSRWTGPFIVRSVSSYGAIEIEDPTNGTTFKVNGQRLKPFLELKSPEIETTLLEDPSYSE